MRAPHATTRSRIRAPRRRFAREAEHHLVGPAVAVHVEREGVERVAEAGRGIERFERRDLVSRPRAPRWSWPRAPARRTTRCRPGRRRGRHDSRRPARRLRRGTHHRGSPSGTSAPPATAVPARRARRPPSPTRPTMPRRRDGATSPGASSSAAFRDACRMADRLPHLRTATVEVERRTAGRRRTPGSGRVTEGGARLPQRLELAPGLPAWRRCERQASSVASRASGVRRSSFVR